ncbi:MAG TPA: NADPH-dependent F420 reductase [Methanobacteriaceae archaeon]|nr:NADPH-dependent F420 reductase [Methanobacteriaceae archaeon]
MKVGIIGGTGDQGLGLALRLAKAGEEIIIGSRDVKKAENAVSLVKNILNDSKIQNIRGTTNEETAHEADIAVLTVPLQAQMITLKSVRDQLQGKILVDATVPLDSCLAGKPTRYVDLWEGSAAERSQAYLKDKQVTVISAFSNISAASLTNEGDVECDCLISGDDLEAKKEVMELAEKIPGVRAMDCGPLENARIVEKITPLLINLNIRNRIKLAGIRITGL